MSIICHCLLQRTRSQGVYTLGTQFMARLQRNSMAGQEKSNTCQKQQNFLVSTLDGITIVFSGRASDFSDIVLPLRDETGIEQFSEFLSVSLLCIRILNLFL